MSTIKTGTTLTTAYQVVGDTTGAFVVQTGSTPTTAMTIDTSQNFGIGTSSPSTKLHVYGGNATVQSSTSGDGNIRLTNTGASYLVGMLGSAGSTALSFYDITNGLERMRIDTSGNVGIGTSSPTSKLDVLGTASVSEASSVSNAGGQLNFNARNNSASILPVSYIKGALYDGTPATYSGGIVFGTAYNNTYGERMRIDSSGNVGIGIAPGCKLDVAGRGRFLQDASGTTGAVIIRQNTGDTSGGYIQFVNNANSIQNGYIAIKSNNDITFANGSSPNVTIDSAGSLLVGTTTQITAGSANSFTISGYNIGGGTGFHGYMQIKNTYGSASNPNKYFRISSTGSLETVNSAYTAVIMTLTDGGAFSATSKSFKIVHPLPELAETKDLVHVSVEAPRPDLIYRGVVTLENGVATVNIDAASNMTEGTFNVLCRNVQCFTTNESDWTQVRGSVEGNILTIEAQDNTSTSTISWMVIGQRKDKTWNELEVSDDNGDLLVEVDRPVVTKPEEQQGAE